MEWEHPTFQIPSVFKGNHRYVSVKETQWCKQTSTNGVSNEEGAKLYFTLAMDVAS